MEGQNKSITFDGREIRLTTGLYAPQANGSVMIECGDTSLLVTATKTTKKDASDFLPLICDYEEKLYAAGRIPGGFMRREGRPPERATLIARLIDRPMRPLFPSWMRDEIQIVASCLSLDERVPADVLAVTGASIATLLGEIPFYGPMAAVRVGLIGDDFILNPSYREIERGDLDIVVAGSPEGIVMIEAGANQLSEQDTIEAIDFGYEAVTELIKSQEDLLKDLGIKQIKPSDPEEDKTLPSYLEKNCTKPIELVLKKFDLSKEERDLELEKIKVEAQGKIESLKDDNQLKVLLSENDKLLSSDFKKLTKRLMRSQIINDGKRVDGRDLDEVRKISASAGILPKRVHGSALFQRGLTQVLSTTTLGTPSDAQEMDDLNPSTEKTYLHHYNFPPYSVGETRPMRTPGRREIGHGALAERAIIPVLPGKETFPYVLRVVSEVLSSNGSTSMGSVCGSTLSLLDAGVPLKAPVSGTAMGLIKEGKEVRILTDIQGIEDFLGDMDFKVAGTENGITSLQMDIKVAGITPEIMKQALSQAKDGRMHILQEMSKAISEAGEFSVHAPRIETMKVATDKIREVIGSGGKVIREIVETSGAKVDISDDGTIKIASPDGASIQKAYDMIYSIVAEPEVGSIYTGTVVKLVDFGAFVNFFGKRDGLVHVSQIENRRLNHPSDVLKEGQEVKVKLMGFDDRGKVRLSMKVVDQETGEEIPVEPRPPRGDRGNRGDRPRRGRARAGGDD